MVLSDGGIINSERGGETRLPKKNIAQIYKEAFLIKSGGRFWSKAQGGRPERHSDLDISSKCTIDMEALMSRATGYGA